MKFKRFIAVFLAAIMLAGLLVGCGGKGKEDEKPTETPTKSEDVFYGENNIKLKVWGPDTSTNLLREQCDAFIAQYPDKKIEIEVVAQGESDAATMVLNDPDTAADVFGFACDQIDKLVGAGVIAPVFKQPNDNAGLNADKIKEMNAENAVESATVDDVLYAFPQTGDNGYMLFYDKRIVSDEQAQSLEGILEACKTGKKKFIANMGDGFYSCLIPFTGGLKLEGLNEDDVQQFNKYDEDKIVSTMKSFGELFKGYAGTFESADVNDIISGMEQGTVAAGFDGSWHSATAMEVLGDNFGVAKLPTIEVDGTDTQIISMHGFKLIGVNRASKFPEASQLLAAYLTNEENQTERAEKLMWGPSNKKAAESDVVKNNAAIAAILEQSNFAVLQTEIAPTFWDPMGNLGNKLIAKDAKLDDATLKTLLVNTLDNIKDE